MSAQTNPPRPCGGCDGTGQRVTNVVSQVGSVQVVTPQLSDCTTCSGSGIAPGR